MWCRKASSERIYKHVKNRKTVRYVCKNLLNKLYMNSIQLIGHPHAVPIDSIIWLEGEASYTRVHLQSATKTIVTQPLSWFEQNLDFIRVHRSAIVNPSYVKEFVQKKGRSGWIRLLDNTIIPVSRDRLDYTAAQLTIANHDGTLSA